MVWNCDRQATASHEHCSVSRNCHQEVRLQFDRLTYTDSMWQIGSSLTVYKCLHGQSKPDWAVNVVAQVAERQQLCCASGHLLVVPRFQLDTYCRRMFTVAGRQPGTRCLTIYEILTSPSRLLEVFRRYSVHWAHSRRYAIMRHIN